MQLLRSKMKTLLWESLTVWLAPLKVPVRSGIRHDRLISKVPGNQGWCVPYEYDEVSPPGCTTGVFVRGISFIGYLVWPVGEEFHGVIRGESSSVESTTFRGTALTPNERFERIYQLLAKVTDLLDLCPFLRGDIPHDPGKPAYKAISASNMPLPIPSKESLTDEKP